MNEVIKYIKTSNIYPHPDNPRKELGELEELVESIKKNGIMQNLTVIPITALSKPPEEQPAAEEISVKSDFHALIGHRRLAAAKLAGLEEVPCKIVSRISLNEQVGIMLEENMQRNDLTIYEQAQGFQMMLDLGESEASIAEKTGFSRSTVRRRLAIAKLDPVVLKKKELDDCFQLSLKDLYELDKIEDLGVRNRILTEARDSRDMVWRAKQAVSEEKRKKMQAVIEEMLKEKGIRKAPKKVENERWTYKWESVKEYDLEKPAPEEIVYKSGKKDELFYVKWGHSLHIIRSAKKKPEKKNPVREEFEQRMKQVKSLTKDMQKRRHEFIHGIIDGDIAPLKEDIRDELICCMIENNVGCYTSTLKTFLTGKNAWDCSDDEKAEADKKIETMTSTQKMLVLIHENTKSEQLNTYDGTYDKAKAGRMKSFFDLLKKYGWSFEEGEEALLDGSSPLYYKEEKR